MRFMKDFVVVTLLLTSCASVASPLLLTANLAAITSVIFSTSANASPAVNARQLQQKLQRNHSLYLIDVREPHEWQAGYIPRAIHIPRGKLPSRIASAVPNKSANIVIYCRTDRRSQLAVATLKKMGYHNVLFMRGGITDWRNAGLPIRK